MPCGNLFHVSVRPGRPDHTGIQPRAGYTLVELLVVVMIVLILIAAALPVAKSVMESNRTREASRQLNAHLAMARAYAARNNRPFGLWMEMDSPIGGPTTVKQVTRIYLAEVQAPYAGSTTSARGRIRDSSGSGTGPWIFEAVDMASPPNQDTAEMGILGSLINDGETFLVKFDYKGDWYRCLRSGTQFLFQSAVSSNVTPPGYNNVNAPGKPFQILRQPKRVGNPLELSGGTCIDMQYSGMGPEGYGVQAAGGFKGALGNRLTVLFSPGGAVDGLYIDNNAVSPTGTLHFLIGRVEKIAADTVGAELNAANSNIGDPNNFWVSVGRLNGSITTSENYPKIDHDDPSHSTDPWGADRAEYIGDCRELATGRELTGGQ